MKRNVSKSWLAFGKKKKKRSDPLILKAKLWRVWECVVISSHEKVYIVNRERRNGDRRSGEEERITPIFDVANFLDDVAAMHMEKLHIAKSICHILLPSHPLRIFISSSKHHLGQLAIYWMAF